MSERIEVSRVVPAGAAEVFAVLRDPEGHVAIDASGMLQGSDGRPVEAAGESFVVHMDREALGDLPMGKYDVEVVFTRYEPDTEIAWTIHGTIKPPIGHVFGYRLEPVAEGTRVVSYYDWSDAAPEWKGIFPVIGESSLKATLGILDRTVRRGYPRG
ncbi:SRPBCC family protein [Naumannella cuiyingiana]|uniref:Polyketide cyclase n=1 Tax=Naumannella cuiyingiana TaxID=1347891 RepID=A0A7Z0D700_9ACTN|nr:SRPBCC family protein [Naumannella cuiyingiana]NYI70034.1 hypothetical protein [Naumannella cuiyingiana]